MSHLRLADRAARESNVEMMSHAQEVAIGRVSSSLTGESLIDMLAAIATRLLLDLDGTYLGRYLGRYLG